MTKQDKKNTYLSIKGQFLLLTLLIILVLILHYPISFNEIGWDSFAIHNLANSLSDFGHAKWWLHPLSIINMYPYSDISSALPFLLSGISQSTNISGDVTIFWVSLFLGLLSIFTIYLMAGVIFNNSIYKFLVALGFSTSQGILFYTTWTAGTRALFIILLPLIIFTLIKSTNSIRYFILTVFLFLLLLSTHKMYFFLLPVILSLIAVKIIYKVSPYVSVKQFKSFNYIFLLGFLIMFSIPFFTRTFMGEDGSRYVFLIELLTTYLRYNGIAFFFMAGGYAYILLNNNKTIEEYFVLASFVFIAPLMYIGTYMKWFILPLLFLLAGFGLWNVLRSKQSLKFFPIIIIAIVLFSGFYQYIHFYSGISRDRDLNEPVYFAATWSKENIGKYNRMIGQGPTTGERFSSISGIPTMIGIESVDLSYNFVNRSNIKITQISSFMDLGTYFESPFISTDKPKTDWFFDNTFYDGTIEDRSVKSTILSFNFSYLIEDTRGISRFLTSVHGQNELYYSNGQIKIWSLR